jgi:hypothetical protein
MHLEPMIVESCHVQLSKSLQLPVVRRIFGISSIGIKFSLQSAEWFQAPDGLFLGHFFSPAQPIPLSGADRLI